VTNDLILAADLIHENDLICVDDFFGFRYPQITAATCAFLKERRPKSQMVFAGSNNGYICRSKAFNRNDTVIRDGLLAAIVRNGLNVQMNSTSPTADGGCFISWREGDRMLIGPDESLDTIPV
jgi:hypothetical protein